MRTSIFLILTHFFLFVTNALFSQEKYNPSPEFKEFVQIDLEKELITSKINKENGLAYKYTPNMLNEFQQKFFPNEKIQWFEPKEAPSSYFYYKGETASTGKKSQKYEIHVSWESYSDGLEWNFGVTKISRMDVKGNNFFEIISNKKLIENIKKQINYKKMMGNKVDVFLHEYFAFVTEQKSENIPFPNTVKKYNWYGVFYNSKLYLFDEKGEIQK